MSNIKLLLSTDNSIVYVKLVDGVMTWTNIDGTLFTGDKSLLVTSCNKTINEVDAVNDTGYDGFIGITQYIDVSTNDTPCSIGSTTYSAIYDLQNITLGEINQTGSTAFEVTPMTEGIWSFKIDILCDGVVKDTSIVSGNAILDPCSIVTNICDCVGCGEVVIGGARRSSVSVNSFVANGSDWDINISWGSLDGMNGGVGNPITSGWQGLFTINYQINSDPIVSLSGQASAGLLPTITVPNNANLTIWAIDENSGETTHISTYPNITSTFSVYPGITAGVSGSGAWIEDVQCPAGTGDLWYYIGENVGGSIPAIASVEVYFNGILQTTPVGTGNFLMSNIPLIKGQPEEIKLIYKDGGGNTLEELTSYSEWVTCSQ